jgi:hypothetical protein
MDRGKVLWGSLISSLIAHTSSMPVKAKAMFDQKLIVPQLSEGQRIGQVK